MGKATKTCHRSYARQFQFPHIGSTAPLQVPVKVDHTTAGKRLVLELWNVSMHDTQMKSCFSFFFSSLFCIFVLSFSRQPAVG